MVKPLHLIKWEHIPLSHQNGYSVLHWVILVTDQVPPFLEWQLPLHISYSTEWPALISDMEETNPLTMTEWLNPYIWPAHQNGSLSPRLSVPSNWPGTSIPRMAFSTHIWHGRNQSYHHDRMAQPLHLTMEGTNPLTMSEWNCTYIWSSGNTSLCHIRMATQSYTKWSW